MRSPFPTRCIDPVDCVSPPAHGCTDERDTAKRPNRTAARRVLAVPCSGFFHPPPEGSIFHVNPACGRVRSKGARIGACLDRTHRNAAACGGLSRTGRMRPMAARTAPFTRCSSPTAARSPSASSVAAGDRDRGAWPSTPRPTGASPRRASPTRRTRRPGPARRATSRGDAHRRDRARAGAKAIHPGYGFLAENAAFARRRGRRPRLIGPPPEPSRRWARRPRRADACGTAGVPVVPGTTEPVDIATRSSRLADEIGYPVRSRRRPAEAARGCGRRDARASSSARSSGAARGARRSATRPSTSRSYLERPRHIEIQVLADAHGNIVHLGERECSIQRRHQKIVEETPSPRSTRRCARGWGRSPSRRRTPSATAARARSSTPRRGRRVLLPRDEHAHPGRAPGDRAGDRARPRARQIRIAAGEPLSLRRRTSAARPRDRVPDQRGGRRSGFPAVDRADRALPRPGGPGRARRLGRAGGGRGVGGSTTRSSPS